MAINQLSNSNTFQHWLIATQQLIAFANSITDAGPNSEFVINSALTVTGTINAQSGIVTTNISTTNLVANNIVTTNIVSTSLNTEFATIDSANINVSTINVATINVANVNTIFFSDGTSLNSNSFIIELTSLGQSAFDKANAANILAQSAYDQANNTGTILISSFDKANAAFDKANSANVLAQAAFDRANTVAGSAATSLSATNNNTTTPLYPVMVGAAGVAATPNVTTSKFEFNASTGTLTLTGPYLTKGASGGVEYSNRSGGSTARYTSYSTNNNFYVYDDAAALNRLTLTSTGYFGVGSNKTSPNATLDWSETVSVHAVGTVSASASRTYILTGSTTVTLPASPSTGDWVKICNRGTTLTSTIARNGSPIMGLNEDMTVNIANISFSLTFAGSPQGWVIT